jgi:hypothetical protein
MREFAKTVTIFRLCLKAEPLIGDPDDLSLPNMELDLSGSLDQCPLCDRLLLVE